MSGGVPAFFIFLDNRYVEASADTAILSTDTWHHVAVVFDAAHGEKRIHIDGALDATIDTDQVALTPPALSSDRRMLATTAMVDGLRIGGALTALEILRSMI